MSLLEVLSVATLERNLRRAENALKDEELTNWDRSFWTRQRDNITAELRMRNDESCMTLMNKWSAAYHLLEDVESTRTALFEWQGEHPEIEDYHLTQAFLALGDAAMHLGALSSEGLAKSLVHGEADADSNMDCVCGWFSDETTRSAIQLELRIHLDEHGVMV